MSIDNGVASGSTTYTVELQPTQTGEFTIPAVVAQVNGTRLVSEPLKLKVVRGSMPQAAAAPQKALVRIVPPTANAYLGQVIPVEVKCFSMDGIRIALPQIAGDGFILGAMPNNPQSYRVRLGNDSYICHDFHVAATPTRTGLLTLGPVTWNVAEQITQQTIFGPMAVGDRPFTVTSDTPQINVLPMPTNNAPPSFHGAIGSFDLAEYEAGPSSVGVGDPITLKITIAGSGSFDTVALPANPQEGRDFKAYPPTVKVTYSDPFLQFQGSKHFEQVITPLNADIKELPAFALSYFDPASGSFKTLTHPPIPLSIHATAATPQPTVIASAEQSQSQNQEIVHIKPLSGTLRTPAPPLVRQPGFLALQTLPPLAWIAALLWRRQKDKLANNPRLRRRREVAGLVRKGLAQLPAQAAANDPEQFHTTVLLLLREQLGERLDLPAPAITEAVLDQLNGMDPSTHALLRDLFHACDQYRYTPEHSSQALASLIPKVKAALAALQNVPDGAPARSSLTQGAAMLLLLWTAASARAQSNDFLQANKLYEEGKYAQAASGYEDLLKAGRVSPAVFFNAGNAWFKAGQVGRAIYDYRRAAQWTPRDPDIRANLQFARARAGNPSQPGSRWTRWVARLSLNEWACAASAVVAMFFLLLATRQIWPALARPSGGLARFLAAAGVWLLVCLAIAVHQQLLQQTSIIIVPEAVVRRGPMDQSQSAFTAHDGAELTVLSRDGDWLEVSDASHRVGWLQRKDVEQFP
jgi:hypothetical protein